MKETQEYKESLLLFNDVMNKTEWYTNKNTLTNLFYFTNKKEISYKSAKIDMYCIRGLNFNNKDFEKFNSFFNYVNGFYDFYHRDYNIYCSVAYYKFIPFFDLNLKVRSKFTSVWFDKNAENEIIDYDILLDFDSRTETEKSFKRMVQEINKILKLLLEFNICFYIIPSGSNFQIVIKNNNYCKIEETKLFAENLKERYNLQTLDLIGIGSPFKLMKMPYSWNNNIICYPLTLDLIKNFSLMTKKNTTFFLILIMLYLN